jgi:hypothetical protein
MALRAGHGTGAGVPRIETLPIDELPAGVVAPAALPTSSKPTVNRQANGAPLPGADASELGRLGGLAKAQREREKARLAALAAELLPGMVVEDEAFKTAMPLALEFIEVEMAELAKLVGGGECPNGPSSMVVSAGLQLVASRVLFAKGDFKTASALANDSRQNIAAAHEYTAKLATARSVNETRNRWILPNGEKQQ